MSQDLTPLLEEFGGEGKLAARMVTAADGQPFIQLRIDLGALQMHLDGRPDGERPFGRPTLLDYLSERTVEAEPDKKRPSARQWEALSHEITQFYHRRIALLTLGDAELSAGRSEAAADCFRRALRDAQHNLRGMDFVRQHHSDARFVAEHEQYRTFVLANCGLAAAKLAVTGDNPEEAIEQLKHWQTAIRQAYVEKESGPEADRDPALMELRRYELLLRREHGVEKTLPERLDEAVAAERFEEAARLRDQLRARESGGRPDDGTPPGDPPTSSGPTAGGS